MQLKCSAGQTISAVEFPSPAFLWLGSVMGMKTVPLDMTSPRKPV